MIENGKDTPRAGATTSSGEAPLAEHKRRWRILVPAAFTAIFLFVCSLPLQVCRDWAFICENTGSHKGYRQWCAGWRTGEWYRQSRLEQFMREQHPSELNLRWTSYAGTGKNILGQPTLLGHGRPQVGMFIMRQAWFDAYVDTLDDAEKLALYRVLAAGNAERIRVEEEKIFDMALAGHWDFQ